MRFFKRLGNFMISKKFIINFLLLCFVWVAIIFGGKMYFGVYTDHGKKVDVPNLLNNNVKDISTLIGERRLKYEVLDSIYNPNLIEGTVIYQNPMATDSTGLMVKYDRVIKVRVSKRSRLVAVPIVVSKSQRFAEAVLKSKGLRTRINLVPSREDQGSVIAQKIGGKEVVAGQQVPINTLVELVVGKRSTDDLVEIPNLAGLTINEAEQRFEQSSALKLHIICSDCYSKNDSLNAKIIRQTPVPSDSSLIPEGSTIIIFASPNSVD